MLFTEPGAAAVKTVQSSVYVGISVYHIMRTCQSVAHYLVYSRWSG